MELLELLKKLQTWCNDNQVDMNKIDFEYAFSIHSKLGHFDFSIENSLNK